MTSFRQFLCLASVSVLLCASSDLPKPCSGKGGEEEKTAKEPDAAAIALLIDHLGSPKFTEREKATKALQAIGLPALHALRKASKGSIPEVSRRATRLAEIIGKSFDQLLADEKQFAVVYPKFQKGEWGPPLLEAEIDKKLPAALPSSDECREKLAKQQVNAAVALLRMNRPEKVWPLLKHSPDPRVRSYLIHRLGPLGADAGAIIKRLDEEPDITIRRALILSLGEFGDKELPSAARNSLLPKLQDIYRTDADPGLHASAEWLLRHWKQDGWLNQVNGEWARDTAGRAKRIESIQQLVKKGREKTPPQWYVNGQGGTMVVIPGPLEFLMGSPSTEEGRCELELQHKKRIGRTFALAAKPVTREQYHRFEKGYNVGEMAGLPAGAIDWYMAAQYCNWLSEKEGISADQWCYEIKENEISLKEGYLSLSGYRLATEAEMEYATRAGAMTARYYGETEELLPKYAWYMNSSQEQPRSVGSLKPNDLGFFDLHGNVWTWCQERYQDYEGNEDKEDVLTIIPTEFRVLHGGSCINQASLVRSAFRLRFVPTYRNNSVGFRPARTFMP
jgi:formylglycine-generating enzyme required for sulfatase activity